MPLPPPPPQLGLGGRRKTPFIRSLWILPSCCPLDWTWSPPTLWSCTSCSRTWPPTCPLQVIRCQLIQKLYFRFLNSLQNLLLRQTLLKYSVGRLGTICAWPSGAALSWDNRQRDSDHLFCAKYIFYFPVWGPFFGGLQIKLLGNVKPKTFSSVRRQC